MKRKLAEGFPLKLSSLISAHRAGSQSGQGTPQLWYNPPSPSHPSGVTPPHPPPNTPRPIQFPRQGNLDSWAVLTFCYIYSMRGMISVMTKMKIAVMNQNRKGLVVITKELNIEKL